MNEKNGENLNISDLSINELKQLLSRVNHDLKMGKPALNRKAKAAARINIIDNEYIIANEYAAKYNGNKQVPPSDNDKLKADIQIQKDILEFIQTGGRILTRKPRKSSKLLTSKALNRSAIISL